MNKRATIDFLRTWPASALVYRSDGTPRFGRDEALALAADMEREAEEKEKAAAAAAAMPAEEVAKQLREVRDGVGYPGPIWARAADAFIAKVEGERTAATPAVKPKVTLQGLALLLNDLLQMDFDAQSAPTYRACITGCSNTIRRLGDEGGELLKLHFDAIGHDTSREPWVLFLRSLGVEPRP